MDKCQISIRLRSLAIDLSVLCSLWAIISIIYVYLNMNFKYVYYNCFVMSLLLSLFFCKDIFGSQSLGKRYCKIIVVSSIDKQNISISRLIKRNIFVLIWPIELLLLIISNNRIGDAIAKTKVVTINNNIVKSKKGITKSIIYFVFMLFATLSISFLLLFAIQ